MPSPLDPIPDRDLAEFFAGSGDAPAGIPAGATLPEAADALSDPLATRWGEPATQAAGYTTVYLNRPAVVDEPPVKARRVGRPGEADLDYEVGALIGKGGGGRVFEARQVSANRTVALKRLLPELAGDPSMRARFLREALLAAEFDHPHLLAVHDVGVDQDQYPFFVMPRVEGIPWSRTLRERSLPDNLGVLAQLADAAAHLHARGVIHRDLKPSNVLLGPHGEVLLMDWGLAVRLPDPGKGRGVPPGTVSGGTPAYMAPEMARDDRALIGFASDVFLLGAILHEILTGAPPHSGMNAAHALSRAAGYPGANVPPSGPAGDLARTALSVDPVRRPKAEEFAAAARRAIRVGKRRFRYWAAATACIVIALAGIGGRLLFWRSQTAPMAPAPPPAVASTDEPRDSAVPDNPTGTSRPVSPPMPALADKPRNPADKDNRESIQGTIMTGSSAEETNRLLDAAQP